MQYDAQSMRINREQFSVEQGVDVRAQQERIVGFVRLEPAIRYDVCSLEDWQNVPICYGASATGTFQSFSAERRAALPSDDLLFDQAARVFDAV